MAWEKRKRGGRYFTRSVRINGRVVRFYFGAGPVAEAVAALDAQKRTERATRLKAVAEEQACVEQIEAELEALDDLCRDLVHASMEEAGYHEHRGQWRRYRSRPSQAVSSQLLIAVVEEV